MARDLHGASRRFARGSGLGSAMVLSAGLTAWSAACAEPAAVPEPTQAAAPQEAHTQAPVLSLAEPAPVEVPPDIDDPSAWPIMAVPKAPEPANWTDKEKAAIAFTKDVAIRVRRILDDPSLDAEQRRLALRAVVRSDFEVERLGRILLGRHLGEANKWQIEAYGDVITDYLVPLYAGRLRDLAAADTLIVDAHDRGDALFVRTAILGAMGEQPVFVDWRVSEQPDASLRLLDLAVAGVSVAQSKRDEFDAVISNKGINAFLDMMSEQAGRPVVQPLAAPLEPPPLVP